MSDPDPSACAGPTPLADAARASAAAEAHSFHMPGHKQRYPPLTALLGAAAVALDVSEMDGRFPYLHSPSGALAEAQHLAARRWGADATWFLVNGSTIGNVAAILALDAGDAGGAAAAPPASAATGPGVLVVMRASHRSVYTALGLSDLEPAYLGATDAPWDVPTADELADLLARTPQVRGVHVTRPNYYGRALDIAAFAAVTHRYGVPLVVDEAHGAHFGLAPGLPEGALAAGADVVVQSTHKSLGALTQASMLHLRRGRVDERRLAQHLQTLQSSSPSALLTASLDVARAHTTPEVLGAAVARALALRARLADAGWTLLPNDDPCKVVLDVRQLGCSGTELAERLRNGHGMGSELADARHVVCTITAADDDAAVDALAEALSATLDDAHHALRRRPSAGRGADGPRERGDARPTPVVDRPIRVAERTAWEDCALAAAAGRVSAEYLIPYPPGIPLLVPGEVVTDGVLAALRAHVGHGGRIVGPRDASGRYLAVLR